MSSPPGGGGPDVSFLHVTSSLVCAGGGQEGEGPEPSLMLVINNDLKHIMHAY